MPKILIIEACRQCSHRYWVGDECHCWEKNGRTINCNPITEIPEWCELDDAEEKDANS